MFEISLGLCLRLTDAPRSTSLAGAFVRLANLETIEEP